MAKTIREFNEELSSLLRRYMDRTGETQERLGAKIKHHGTAVFKWVNGRVNNHDPKTLRRLGEIVCPALGLRPDYLLREYLRAWGGVEFADHEATDACITAPVVNDPESIASARESWPLPLSAYKDKGVYILRLLEPDAGICCFKRDDYVIAQGLVEPKPGDVVIAKVDGRTLVRRLILNNDIVVLTDNEQSVITSTDHKITLHGVLLGRFSPPVPETAE